MEEYVLVTAKEYKSLLKAEEELSRLEAAGVDNWCGYGEGEFETTLDEDVADIKLRVDGMVKYTAGGGRLGKYV